MASALHGVVVHGHFYQPPREHPWLELVERETSAFPDPDWNARITRECYAPLSAMPLFDALGRVQRVVNAYAHISFNVGPTLLEWMERESPSTWEAMRAGDAASVARYGGHGNAIATPYHHVILPLASRRDKVTEVRWGIADFKRRFGRDPEGFWLPECAVDEETLEVLAREGIRFTILAPWQVAAQDPHGLPLRWDAGGGREIVLCPYDGSLAGDVAFGQLINDDHALASRIAARAQHVGAHGPSLSFLATDGETFGHHHRKGAETLVRALWRIAAHPPLRLTNLAAWIAEHPPHRVAELRAPSAWSCAHGVGRWERDCGCKAAGDRPTSQAWRTTLRDAMNRLAALAHAHYETAATPLFRDDPWTVRDGYGAVVAQDGDGIASWVRAQLRTTDADLDAARTLLEMERAILRCFTSCAWFFDDVSGLEVQQVLRYAAYALELGGRSTHWLPALLTALAPARSNHGTHESAADLFVRSILPTRPPAVRVAAGAVAMVAAESSGSSPRRIGALDVEVSPASRSVRVTHRRTGQVSAWRHSPWNGTGDVVLTPMDHDGPPAHVGPFDFAQGDALRLAARHATAALETDRSSR
jgi:alpha-amylase/alpha-mannosidase (GH57 family)